MVTLLYIVHFIAALSLIMVVLLQSGKGGGLGSSFGGAASSATKIFGGGGTTNVLGRTTVIIATIFMATSLALAYTSSHEDSVMDLSSEAPGSASSQEEQIVETGSNDTAAENKPNDINAPEAPAENVDGLQLQKIDAPTQEQPAQEQPAQDLPSEN